MDNTVIVAIISFFGTTSSGYANISKGGVSITHYFNEKMVKRLNHLIKEYNDRNEKQMISKRPLEFYVQGCFLIKVF